MPRPGPDESAILRAVCRRPADDLPRLVYADWLDDHKRPDRAEFIRLQIDCDGDTAWSVPWERDARILALRLAHGAGWLRGLPKWAAGGWDLGRDQWPEFSRGFVERFAVVASQFVRYGPQLLDRTPVRHLRLIDPARVIPDVVRCGWLREVPSLDLGDVPLGDAGAVALAGAEWLDGVRSLSLYGTGVGDRGVRALAGCPFLAGLESLDLAYNHFSLDGVRRLAGSSHLRTVREILVLPSFNAQVQNHTEEVITLLQRPA